MVGRRMSSTAEELRERKEEENVFFLVVLAEVEESGEKNTMLR